MPSKFNHKNGGHIAGYSDKWKDSKRPETSFQAGSGSRASRNQGYGAQGKANTVASDVIDTSKMSAPEKLKYFRELGLIPPQEEPTPFNPKVLLNELQTLLQGRPDLTQSIVKELQGLDKGTIRYVSEEAYNALQRIKTKTNDPARITQYVVREIQKAKE